MPTTHFPNGVTNATIEALLGSYVAPAPNRQHLYFNDFDLFTVADWTVTETQAGATQAVVSGDGGLLALTNSAALNDINAIALANTSFVMDPAKSFWMAARLQMSDVVNTEVLFGLVDTMAALNPANGVYLYKASAATPLRLSIEKASVVTSSSNSAGGLIANNTMVEVGISYQASEGVIYGWAAGTAFATIANLTNLPTVALAPAIGFRNANAVANVVTVDYLMVAKER
jgi:hypothetical protein